MAEKLAKIWCTETDGVNCPFYFKIGSCRYGDKCARIHHKPVESQTLLIPHMYSNPPFAIAFASGIKIPEEHIKEMIRHFEDFYEEVFTEISNFAEIADMYVSDNIGDHMIGNVYVKFFTEEDAAKALNGLHGRYYEGKILAPEYSPVTDFREGRCKMYDQGACTRGGYCNFMHMKYLSKSFKRELYHKMYEDHPEYKEQRRRREEKRSRSPSSSSDDEYRRHRRSKSKSRKQGSKKPSSHERKHRHRSRSRYDSKERSRSTSDDSKNNSKSNRHNTESEERRAMIEKWNQETAAKSKINA